MSTATSTPLSTSPSTTAPTGPPSPTNDADDTPLATPTDAETDAPVKREFDESFVQQETTEVAKNSRLHRLNFLLEQSSVYTKILSDKMEKQRIDRLKAESRAANKSIKEKTTLVAAPERRSGRSAVEDDKAAGASVKKEDKGAKGKGGKSVSSSKRKVEKLEMEEALEEAVGYNATAKKARHEAPGPSEHGVQPAAVTGAELRDYQLAGLNWLISLYENGLNGILADEMGLGKTLQTISFLAHLKSKGVWGPFLVVCPMSVLQNWDNEFQKFTPDIPVMQYYGNPQRRKFLRQTVLTPPKDATGAQYAGQMMAGGGKPLSKMTKTERREAIKPVEVVQNTTGTFPVVLTTFDMAIKDARYLRGFQWKYIVVDEGHRLKNMDCMLIKELKTFSSANRLILTGTPLHNNLSELWSLLNFILPDIFDDLESFQQWFDLDADLRATSTHPKIRNAPASTAAPKALISDDSSKQIVSKLHSILKPFLLRRLKVDVEKSLPPKKEYLLHAPLTVAQRDLYEHVVQRNIRAFLIKKKTGMGVDQGDVVEEEEEEEVEDEEDEDEEGAGRKQRNVVRKDYTMDLLDNDDKYFDRLEQAKEEDARKAVDEPSDALALGRAYQKRVATQAVNNMRLSNVIMQLRKVASHPFLFDWPIDYATGQPVVNKNLVEASGKMLLLNRLLDALFARKHKVLLFSQFTSMLDIIEDWATEFKGLKICRIDGNTKQADRQRQMNEFNNAGEEDGVCRLFILSTRAGGLGINLVAADTVIFYDQDWNPQMDLQAQDRAHRIGQKRPVLIFRLVTAHTVEEKILKKAGAKRRLEAMVIADGKFKGGVGQEKRVSAIDEATALLKLEGDKIDLVDAGDKIIADDDLEMLLDRSPEAYGRTKGWHSAKSAGGTLETAKVKKDKGENTMFEVFEAAKDDVNDGLADMRDE